MRVLLLVRCAFDQHRQDGLQHAVEILDHVAVPEPQHPKACTFEYPRLRRITFRCMLSAIKFDDQHRIETCKVRDVSSNRVLPSEFESSKAAVADGEPEDLFDVGLIGPEASGVGAYLAAEPDTFA